MCIKSVNLQFYNVVMKGVIMKDFLKNYKQTIILLASIIVGAIVGLIFKEKTAVLSPFGDVFINMMFVVIVPLIFLTITTSIAKMKSGKRLGKVLVTIFVIFFVTSLVALVVGLPCPGVQVATFLHRILQTVVQVAEEVDSGHFLQLIHADGIFFQCLGGRVGGWVEALLHHEGDGLEGVARSAGQDGHEVVAGNHHGHRLAFHVLRGEMVEELVVADRAALAHIKLLEGG